VNWEAIGAIGEILGAMAVFFSLVYLALQVRQNSRYVQSQNINSQAEQLQKFAEIQAMPQVLSSLKMVYVNGETRPEFLDATMIEAYILSGLSLAQAQYRHKAAGLISDMEWRPSERIMKMLMGPDYIRTWWTAHGHQIFDDDFASEVNRVISTDYEGDFWTRYQRED
jgi:hypothetical protein